MAKTKVLFTAEADPQVLTALESECELELAGWNTGDGVFDEETLIKRLKGKAIFATSYDKVTRRVIEESPDLKLIVCTRANPVNVDWAAAKEKGIAVAFTPGRNSDVTAEFAVALLLNVARHITQANRAILDRSVVTDDSTAPGVKKEDVTWGAVKSRHPYTEFQGSQIRNKNAGIVGYGSIGRRVAAILRGFGANILVYDPYCSKVDIDCPGMRQVRFDELLREADFISCHMKVTPETTGIFNYEAFCRMKPTSYFINNSRGAVVVEQDLVRALRERRIGGAGLDVYEYEPLYAGHPFVSGELDNVVVTPHISGASPDAITNGTIMLVDEIQRFLHGEPLLNHK